MSFNRKTGKDMNKRRKWGKLTLLVQIIMVITLLVVFLIMVIR
jgi:cell division septal protein FtsQ